jgi:hypothetical protein
MNHLHGQPADWERQKQPQGQELAMVQMAQA